jgi:DNA replication licensing factor MCM2
VNLSDPILSRFDIMCVLKDEVDASVDSDLATFIINSHIKSHPNVEEDEILPALLDDPKAA